MVVLVELGDELELVGIVVVVVGATVELVGLCVEEVRFTPLLDSWLGDRDVPTVRYTTSAMTAAAMVIPAMARKPLRLRRCNGRDRCGNLGMTSFTGPILALREIRLVPRAMLSDGLDELIDTKVIDAMSLSFIVATGSAGADASGARLSLRAPTRLERDAHASRPLAPSVQRQSSCCVARLGSSSKA